MMNPPPISIGIFTALVKENGFDVELFDTTFYSDPDEMGSDEAKEKFLMVRPADDSERSSAVLKKRMEDELIRKVEEYQPDIITISLLESTYPIALAMLDAIKYYIEEHDVKVLAGGVFAYSAPEIVFDEITELAAEILDCPISFIEFMDKNRQWFKSKYGLPDEVVETPRDAAVCATTICQNDLLLVPDCSKDERFAELGPVKSDPFLKFYAGNHKIIASPSRKFYFLKVLTKN